MSVRLCSDELNRANSVYIYSGRTRFVAVPNLSVPDGFLRYKIILLSDSHSTNPPPHILTQSLRKCLAKEDLEPEVAPRGRLLRHPAHPLHHHSNRLVRQPPPHTLHLLSTPRLRLLLRLLPQQQAKAQASLPTWPALQRKSIPDFLIFNKVQMEL